MSFSRLSSLCIGTFAMTAVVWLTSTAPATAQPGSLRITEVMSSSAVTGGTPDWFEVTNYGSSAVPISGWRMDDSSFAILNSVPLNGVSSIGAGESVLFLEAANTVTDYTAMINSFRTFWGGTAATAQIGYFQGSGVGLSSTGDGVVLFNGASPTGVESTPRVTFGAATTGFSFYYTYDSAGNPATSPNSSTILSAVGTLDGQVTFTSADPLANTASPGTAAIVPEPSTVALAAVAVLGLAGLAARRQSPKEPGSAGTGSELTPTGR